MSEEEYKAFMDDYEDLKAVKSLIKSFDVNFFFNLDDCFIKKLNEKDKLIQELKQENILLKNTKNNCPATNTSGIKCSLKNDDYKHIPFIY